MRPEELCQWKIAMTPAGNRTRDLPACSVVPQPAAPPRAPIVDSSIRNYFTAVQAMNISTRQSQLADSARFLQRQDCTDST